MLKKDGKCFTNYNIQKGNYMQKLYTLVSLKKENHVADSEKKFANISQMYTILKFYNDKNEAHCQMNMRIEKY